LASEFVVIRKRFLSATPSAGTGDCWILQCALLLREPIAQHCGTN